MRAFCCLVHVSLDVAARGKQIVFVVKLYIGEDSTNTNAGKNYRVLLSNPP